MYCKYRVIWLSLSGQLFMNGGQSAVYVTNQVDVIFISV